MAEPEPPGEAPPMRGHYQVKAPRASVFAAHREPAEHAAGKGSTKAEANALGSLNTAGTLLEPCIIQLQWLTIGANGTAKPGQVRSSHTALVATTQKPA